MKSWDEFSLEAPDLAEIGMRLLFPSRIGRAFLATIRKNGAPRLHPIALVQYLGRLFLLVPRLSPKCGDLIRDGRYAMQAFPSPVEQNEEFYLAGRAVEIDDDFKRQLIEETGIRAEKDEVLFELFCEWVMHTHLENVGTEAERPIHQKWHLSNHTLVEHPS